MTKKEYAEKLAVRNIISDIEEKAADGNYIYRGEPECYTQSPFCGKVSSSLWRQLQSTFTPHDRINFDYNVIQESYLKDARRYGGNLYQDDFELASQLQHTGGNTNLIDFTKDCLVALFFACDGSHDEPGRVILFERTEDKRSEYKIKVPQHPINRIAAQKSVFVQPSQGFIEQDEIKTVCVKAELKKSILTYLRKHHGIYTQTIYNDLQGYIKHQKIHHKAYREYGRGQLWRRNNPGRIVSVNGKAINEDGPFYTAIKYYDRAIELCPDFVEAYYARAQVYRRIDDFDKAIKDFTSVIELDPDYASAYAERGGAYFKKGCYARAIENFNRAIELDPDYASAYVQRGLAYSEKGCDARAIDDFRRAKKLGADNARELLKEARKKEDQKNVR